jgi:predicted dehydrogenase
MSCFIKVSNKLSNLSKRTKSSTKGNYKSKELISFGIVGGGLMGREIASAAARWCHLLDLNFTPVITAVCSRTSKSLQWFEDNIPTLDYTTTYLQKILEDPKIDAIYCAVPHHLHKDIYIKIIKAGKHLLGEKPFGIDLEANLSIVNTVKAYPQVLVRCASQFAYYPGAYRIAQWLCENRIGKIIDVEVGFWHSSDLNPLKPINWKRKIETNGNMLYGDLGMLVLFIPSDLDGCRKASMRFYPILSTNGQIRMETL